MTPEDLAIRNQRIVDCFNDGMPTRSIATRFNLSKETVCVVLRRAGVTTGKRVIPTQAQIATTCFLLGRGARLPEITRASGMSQSWCVKNLMPAVRDVLPPQHYSSWLNKSYDARHLPKPRGYVYDGLTAAENQP